MGGGKRDISSTTSSTWTAAAAEPQAHADFHGSFGDGVAGASSGPPPAERAIRSVSGMEGAESSQMGAAHRRDGSSSGEMLECTVGSPIKEGDGTKDAFISYLVTTHTSFQSFQKQRTQVRRRFTDFVYLHKSLSRDNVSCAIPPMPTKERMEYIRGDRFGPDFTSRRAKSLQRFLFRLTQHPVLRRVAILHLFLESSDWNATMSRRSARNSVAEGAAGGGNGMFDSFTDSLLNAFTKVHRPNQRFIEVRDRCSQLEDNLSGVEKVVSRVARREGELETDLRELAEQFQKLITLEPGVEDEVRAFAASVEDTAAGWKRLHDLTDQDYVGSLHDMQAYSVAFKALLKIREQKQLDHEQLVEYLNKARADRDVLIHGNPNGSFGGGGGGGGGAGSVAGSFLRNRLENMQGMDPEQARRDRIRRLEMDVDRLTPEVSAAKKTTELFDEEVVREADEFERIRRVEFKHQLAGLANAHIALCDEAIKVWEQYVADMTPAAQTATAEAAGGD